MENNNSNKENYSLKKKQKELKKKKESFKRNLKSFLKIFIFSLLILGGIVYIVLNIKTLPPTSPQGHVEVVPKSHILTEEMPENVQRHMLEHAEGNKRPGVIIQYNCFKFECEDDLVDKLSEFVEKYPDFVYLAPSSKYDGKIILTKPAKLKILDSFDKEKIEKFIN